MQISLFICECERNRVDKTDYLANRIAIDGSLRTSTSAMNLEILLEKSNPITYKYNYMYISDFDRFYFIDDIISYRTGLWIIKASVDVLMSFKNDIIQSEVIIDKAENEMDSNLYLDDGSFVMDSRKYNEVKEFPSGLNENGSFILICAGGL